MSELNVRENNTSDIEKNIPNVAKPQTKSDLFEKIIEHLTTVAHVGILSVTVYIVYISCLHFEFFNWHPILYSIGWFCLMTEAIFMLTKENILSQRISYIWRVRYHWLIQIIAVGCSIGGFIVVFLYEEQENNAHFKTTHGIVGLIAMIFALFPTCLSGIPALFSFKLRAIISPKINKMIHATSGIISVILGAVTMVLSLYTGWFGWKTEGNQDIFIACYVPMVFGLLWCLFRPCITLLQRLQAFMN